MLNTHPEKFSFKPFYNGSYLEFGSLSKMAVEGDLYVLQKLWCLELEIKGKTY